MIRRLIPAAALFCSLSTLVCCALPALFVALGAGASFVALLAVFPQLIWLSEHKVLVFSVAGSLLVLSAFVRFGTARQCPTDPQLARQCRSATRISHLVFFLSLALYTTGVFFAFLG